MRKRINNLLFIFGVVAVIVMFFSFDVSFSELCGYINKANYWLVAILVLWIGLYGMNAGAWWVIIRGSGPTNMSFLRLYKLTITGFALNYATPCGLAGGEPYRVMELSRYIDARRATSSVILFGMMHIFSHFWFWLTSIVVYLLLAAIGDLLISAAVAWVLLFASLFCCGGIYLFLKGYKNGLTVKLVKWLSKLPGLHKRGERFLQSHITDLERIDQQISELHSQNKRSFMGSLLLEYFGRILQSFEIFFMLLFFGIDGGGTFGGYVLVFLHSFLILAFTSLFANLLGFMPMQLGGREGGFAMSVAQMGMTGGIAMFVSIISRVREFIWICVGLALMKIFKNE